MLNQTGPELFVDKPDLKVNALACNSSPTQAINVITNENQKKLLFELIGQIFNVDTKREYLKKLKDLVLFEKEESKSLKFNYVDTSVSKIINKYPRPNPFYQITTKEIQVDISELKCQICTFDIKLLEAKIDTLELKAKLALLKDNELSSSNTN